MARLFVAVRPPLPVLEAVAALPRPDEAGVRWVRREQWHVTVRFVGEADEAAVHDALVGSAGELAALGSVAAVVGPAVSRLGRLVVCLPVQGLEGVASVVSTATAGLGDPVDPRPFAGHLTLARLQKRAACGVAGAPFSATFPVTEVELVRSTLGRGGAVHEVVATVPVGTWT